MIGLISFQLYWIQSMTEANAERFKKDVMESLKAVASKLEKQEIYAAHQKLSYINTSVQNKVDTKGQQTRNQNFNQRKFDFRIQGNGQVMVMVDTFIFKNQKFVITSEASSFFWDQIPVPNSSLEEELQEKDFKIQELEAQLKKISRKYELTFDLVNNLMMPGRSLSSRFNPQQLDSLLNHELLERGIDIEYNYGVVAPNLDRFVYLSHNEKHQELLQSEFKASLFPNDLYSKASYIVIDFPNKENYLFGKIWTSSISSGVLVLVILFCFGYSIAIILKQKKLSEMKNDFINNMTHELKTPISTVSLAVEALSDKDIENSSLKTKYLHVIHEENKRLYNQVEKVLQIAAIDRNDYNLKEELLHMNHTVREATSHIAMQVEQRGGRINLIENAHQDLVKGDETHLTNIVLNLLDNANKYSPDAPTITLRTESDENHFVVSIQDKGVGMTKEQQKHIFEKFYRVPTGNLHNVKGFGLGLAYVHRMVQAHGGEIHVESEPGKGSKFSIKIPLCHEQ